MSDLRISVIGPSFDDVRARLVEHKIASGIAARDATLWGPEAEPEASIRLGWVDLPVTSRPLLAEIEALQADLRAEGLDRVVLCGMGGSSLAPEVITRTAGVELTVLDTTDPQAVRRAVSEGLDRTVVVVSSKSGGTVETDSQRRAFLAAFEAAGIDGPSRIVVVTDPGSGLADLATAAGYRKVFLADPEVGGRYSALSAFGLVPSGLAGADIAGLLDDAEALGDLFAEDSDDNPALILGAALGGTEPLRDKIAIADAGSGIAGFPDWAEQLVAESTGKQGSGLLPVAVEGLDAPEIQWPADDVLPVRLVGPDDEEPADDATEGPAVDVGGALGAQLLLWEYATAVASWLLGINPFDQPDVESAKVAARGLLDARPAPEAAAFVDGAIEVRGTPGLLDGVDTARGCAAGTARSAGAAWLPGRHGLPRPGGRRGPGRRTTAPGQDHGAARDVRLGSAVPALDGPVPQGRPSPAACSSRSPGPARRTSQCPTGPTPSASSSPPRRRVTRRSWPITDGRSFACT